MLPFETMTVPGAADAKFAREAWIRALQRTAAIETDLNLTLPLLIGRQAQGYGAAPALLSNEGSLSYAQLSARCNQYARWGLSQGLRAGDVAAFGGATCYGRCCDCRGWPHGLRKTALHR